MSLSIQAILMFLSVRANEWLFPFVDGFHVGEECSDDTEEGEERAHLKYKLYACDFSKPSEKCCTDAAEPE